MVLIFGLYWNKWGNNTWCLHITADTHIVVRMSADILHESLCFELLMLRNHDSESICGVDRKAEACTLTSGCGIRLFVIAWSAWVSPGPGRSMPVSPLQLCSASTSLGAVLFWLALQGLAYLQGIILHIPSIPLSVLQLVICGTCHSFPPLVYYLLRLSIML